MYQYQRRNQYFAQISGGFEELAEAELRELGARALRADYRGFHFKANPKTLYRINYNARLLIRVLAPLITFDCHSDRYLHRTAMNIDWSDFIDVDQTFAINAVTSNTPALKHSQYAALKLKDAICDQFRAKTGKRPSVDTRNPDLGIHLYIRNNRATISVDTSGGSLHKRGYRTRSVEAPMAETLAAAIIQLSQWDGERALIDPMCGSGTLLCEAAMKYCRIPAGALRKKWGFECLPDFSFDLWNSIRSDSNAAIRPLPNGLLRASDINPECVRAARVNLNQLPGCKDQFECTAQDLFENTGFQGATVVINPPYGVRLSNRDKVEKMMKELGDFLKQRCTGSTAYIYTGDRKLLKKVGLKPEWKRDLNNGGIEGVLGKLELY